MKLVLAIFIISLVSMAHGIQDNRESNDGSGSRAVHDALPTNEHTTNIRNINKAHKGDKAPKATKAHPGDKAPKAPKAPKATKAPNAKYFAGVNDLDGYQEVARNFVGLNPIEGVGSGFVLSGSNRITSPTFPEENPQSGGPRQDMCTYDCVAVSDGVGCVGWGGVNFRYSSLLWTDPYTNKWDGQIQATELKRFTDTGKPLVAYLLRRNTTDTLLNFMGSDHRAYPGGHMVFNVACTTQDCNKKFSDVSRQGFIAVSCEAGLADKAGLRGAGDTKCATRCENADTYTEWLTYCEASVEGASLGFSGYSN